MVIGEREFLAMPATTKTREEPSHERSGVHHKIDTEVNIMNTASFLRNMRFPRLSSR
jgi:hypothetical protein